MQVRRCRVHTPMPGVYATGTFNGFVSIPSGAVLIVNRSGDGNDLYVKVQWDNRELLVFPRDLAERTVECEIPPRNAA